MWNVLYICIGVLASEYSDSNEKEIENENKKCL